MMQGHYNLSDRLFDDIVLQDLLPVLTQCLDNHPRLQIVWLYQTPTTDLVGPVKDVRNIIIHMHKIRNFNNVIRRILK